MRGRFGACALAVLTLTLGTEPAAAERDPATHVDPMIGTWPPGFVFPGAATPFGMVQNSPDTTGEFAYSGYLATDPIIRGFSLVHLSGPGVKKGGDIPFMPFVGVPPPDDPNLYGSTYSHARERAEAGYYSVELDRPATRVELTASTRAGMQRYTFPPVPAAGLLVDPARSAEGRRGEGHVEFTGPDEISGWHRGRYPVYFAARFDRPFVATGDFGDGGAWMTFDATRERQVTMRVGISFVDLEGARRNLEAEAPTFDFDGMRRAAFEAWNRGLSTVRVRGGSDGELTSFYTALYHAQLHPNVFTDVDGRYLGFDGQPHVAAGRTQYANFSLWDTYKAQNQLLALIQPRRYREMLLSLLANAREGGRLPRWSEHNIDPAHMSGDPAIQTVTDGYCRGLLEPAQAAELYGEAVELRGHRPAELDQLGYLPMRPGTTLEYGVADFALALMAQGLGRSEDAARWRAASRGYRNILDPETRWIRPRNADGSWHSPFFANDETGFQEGNSWQYSWLAPHDARGLYDAMGGDRKVVRRLDAFFALPPDAQNQANLFGLVYRTPQYAPGNEHDLQVPWMYPFAHAPWKTQREQRDIQALFRPTLDGLPGNDDLGSLSAWYVFSALGFGPVTPGAPFYVLGSPQFDGADVSPVGGRGFKVRSEGASLLRRYVRSARLGGRPLRRAWFTERSLLSGGTLKLDMGALPNRGLGSNKGEAPPSVSDSSLDRFGCSPRR
jgi:predicted alpha-1,2-mannosidase